VLGYPVIGNDDDLGTLVLDCENTLITLGQIKSAEARMRLFQRVKEIGASVVVVISPYARISHHADVGEGSIIMHEAVVNAGCSIGENCIINTNSLIEHDVEIGPHCHISTGVCVNGGVSIGRGSFIGSGAVLREGIRIGRNTVIGAGQTVLSDLPPDSVVRGMS